VANVRNPYGGYAPSYHLVNSQLTKAFSKNLEVYVGVENATNYTQENPIIASSDPYNPRFDAAQIYAPVFGRMGYIGMRWTLL
jgi:outer membrane receptor protein involved in Fe transport